MQQTTNYNLLIPEGTDIVNPLTQVNPNFQTIDGAMFANKQSSIGTASEVVTGTVHAIVRSNTDSDVFRFTATGAWAAGDTMTVDGVGVTVHLSDGTTPASGAYIIGAEVLAMINGTLVTLAISTTPPAQVVTSFNDRTGAVVPTASDYDAGMVDYDNTVSGLNSTDTQGAIDELKDLVDSSTVSDTGWVTVNSNLKYRIIAGKICNVVFSDLPSTNNSLATAGTLPAEARPASTILQIAYGVLSSSSYCTIDVTDTGSADYRSNVAVSGASLVYFVG